MTCLLYLRSKMSQCKKNKQANRQGLEANQGLIGTEQQLPEEPPAELQLLLAKGALSLSRQIMSHNSSQAAEGQESSPGGCSSCCPPRTPSTAPCRDTCPVFFTPLRACHVVKTLRLEKCTSLEDKPLVATWILRKKGGNFTGAPGKVGAS